MSLDHVEIDRITGAGGYGKGVVPNPFATQEKEWERRIANHLVLEKIQAKIVSLYEPRYITPPSTAEAIAALVTLTDARSVLELGTHVGFTTYHILKAIYGKPGAKIVTVEARPVHDVEFFAEFDSILTHLNGWTPGCLDQLNGSQFDLVFVDSDHSIEHTPKELDALIPLTHKRSVFVFHDVPEFCTPDNNAPHPVRTWLMNCDKLHGLCLPTGEQADCLATFGEGYAGELNPGLGIFMRA